MLKYEWSEEEARQAIREVSYEEGLSQGISQGISQGLFNAVVSLINNKGFSPDKAMSALNISSSDRAKFAAMLG